MANVCDVHTYTLSLMTHRNVITVVVISIASSTIYLQLHTAITAIWIISFRVASKLPLYDLKIY